MTDLEAQLVENPDDLATWQVYADYLQEQGDPRGTVFQLEQKLSRARSDKERAKLEGELAAIQKQHQPAWTEGFPTAVHVATWRCGFARALAVEWSEDVPGQLAAALALPSTRFVRRVRIVGPQQEDEDEIEDLDDYYENGPPPIEAAALAALELGRVTELDLSYVRLADAGATALAKAPGLDRLETLDLRYTQLGDAGLVALAPRLARVKRLHLQRNALTATGVAALGKLTALVELDLRYNDLGSEGAEAIAKAPFVSQLAKLELYRTDISDEGARILGRSQLPARLRDFWRIS